MSLLAGSLNRMLALVAVIAVAVIQADDLSHGRCVASENLSCTQANDEHDSDIGVLLQVRGPHINVRSQEARPNEQDYPEERSHEHHLQESTGHDESSQRANASLLAQLGERINEVNGTISGQAQGKDVSVVNAIPTAAAMRLLDATGSEVVTQDSGGSTKVQKQASTADDMSLQGIFSKQVSMREVLITTDVIASHLLERHVPRVASLLGVGTEISTQGHGMDPMVFVRLGLLILLPIVVALGFVLYMFGSGSNADSKARGAERSSSRSRSGNAKGAMRADGVKDLFVQSRHGMSNGECTSHVGSYGISQGNFAPHTPSGVSGNIDHFASGAGRNFGNTRQGANIPRDMAGSDDQVIRNSQMGGSIFNTALAGGPTDVSAPQIGDSANLSLRPTLGAAPVQNTTLGSSPGVSVSMNWDLQPYRQNIDVDIVNCDGGAHNDEVVMCALVHEHTESCGVLLESYQGFPVAFLHTAKAVDDQDRPKFMKSRKVSVFAASSVSGISDKPVMNICRENDTSGSFRIVARLLTPSGTPAHKGEAVFEVVMDPRSGQPLRVMHMNGSVVAEVDSIKDVSKLVIHVTFGEDLWLGLAAMISARKLA